VQVSLSVARLAAAYRCIPLGNDRGAESTSSRPTSSCNLRMTIGSAADNARRIAVARRRLCCGALSERVDAALRVVRTRLGLWHLHRGTSYHSMYVATSCSQSHGSKGWGSLTHGIDAAFAAAHAEHRRDLRYAIGCGEHRNDLPRRVPGVVRHQCRHESLFRLRALRCCSRQSLRLHRPPPSPHRTPLTVRELLARCAHRAYCRTDSPRGWRRSYYGKLGVPAALTPTLYRALARLLHAWVGKHPAVAEPRQNASIAAFMPSILPAWAGPIGRVVAVNAPSQTQGAGSIIARGIRISRSRRSSLRFAGEQAQQPRASPSEASGGNLAIVFHGT